MARWSPPAYAAPNVNLEVIRHPGCADTPCNRRRNDRSRTYADRSERGTEFAKMLLANELFEEVLGTLPASAGGSAAAAATGPTGGGQRREPRVALSQRLT